MIHYFIKDFDFIMTDHLINLVIIQSLSFILIKPI